MDTLQIELDIYIDHKKIMHDDATTEEGGKGIKQCTCIDFNRNARYIFHKCIILYYNISIENTLILVQIFPMHFIHR